MRENCLTTSVSLVHSQYQPIEFQVGGNACPINVFVLIACSYYGGGYELTCGKVL